MAHLSDDEDEPFYIQLKHDYEFKVYRRFENFRADTQDFPIVEDEEDVDVTP